MNFEHTVGGSGTVYVTGGNVNEVNNTMKIIFTLGYILEGNITGDKTFNGTILNAAGNPVNTFSLSYVGGD